MNAIAALTPEMARRRLLSTKDSAAFLGISISTFRRLLERKAVPGPIPVSQRRLGWRVGDLADWQDCQAAGRSWHEWKAAQAGNDNRH